MGCDIHINCEFLTEDNRWENCDFYTINPLYDKTISKKSEDYEPKWNVVQVNIGRNYELFGILAGVRDKTNPLIDEPRGVPHDMSKQTKKRYKKELKDSHSFSWLTLKELLDYKNRYETFHNHGYVSPENARLLDMFEETPDEWLSFTNEEGWVYRTWTDNISRCFNWMLEELYVRLDNVFDIHDFYSDEEKMNYRRKVANKFRIVFWFDN